MSKPSYSIKVWFLADEGLGKLSGWLPQQSTARTKEPEFLSLTPTMNWSAPRVQSPDTESWTPTEIESPVVSPEVAPPVLLPELCEASHEPETEPVRLCDISVFETFAEA